MNVDDINQPESSQVNYSGPENMTKPFGMGLVGLWAVNTVRSML